MSFLSFTLEVLPHLTESSCVVFSCQPGLSHKHKQSVYSSPPPLRGIELTLLAAQGWFFCLVFSILLVTPSVLFTFPRAFLTE